MIGRSNAEKVRDNIGTILAAEITTQWNASDGLAANDPDKLQVDKPEVWLERFIPLQKDELPAVIVTYSQTAQGGRSQTRQEDGVTFFVDVYLGRNDTTGAKSMFSLQRVLYLLRKILMDPKYARLNSDAVNSRNINNMAVADPNRENTGNTVMGRLTIEVDITEKQQLGGAPIVGESTTNVTLHATDKGYIYKYEKN